MVDIINREAAGDSLIILAPAVSESGVGREDRQLRLEFLLHLLVVIVANLASLLTLQGIRQQGSNHLHPAALQRLVKKCRGAYLHHLTSNIIRISYCHYSLLFMSRNLVFTGICLVKLMDKLASLLRPHQMRVRSSNSG